ncbi:hypothetical protein KM043_016692 [Ampulex compressa]|nr:hypothetical protein KM043_016692 [Ampulex compressa]
MDMSEDCWDHVGLLQEVSGPEPPPPPPAPDFLIQQQETDAPSVTVARENKQMAGVRVPSASTTTGELRFVRQVEGILLRWVKPRVLVCYQTHRRSSR